MGKGLSMAEIKFSNLPQGGGEPERKHTKGKFTFSNGVSASISKVHPYTRPHFVRVSVVDERTGREVTDEFMKDVEVYGRKIENGCMDAHNVLDFMKDVSEWEAFSIDSWFKGISEKD